MRRERVDHRMQRRAVLSSWREGDRARDSICDAHPALLRAASHLGIPRSEPCPVCATDNLREVAYAYAPQGARKAEGTLVQPGGLQRLLRARGRLRLFRVEVCVSCHWNHLLTQDEMVSDRVASIDALIDEGRAS